MNLSEINEGSGLPHYLIRKRAIMLATTKRPPADWQERLRVAARADDASGVRKLHIREWQLLSTGGTDIGDYVLGPMAPEFFCASLASSLTHAVMVVAAQQELVLERVHAKFEFQVNDSRFFGLTSPDPAEFFAMQASVSIDAPTLSTQEKRVLVEQAQARCGLMQALRVPQHVHLLTEDPSMNAASGSSTGLTDYLIRKRATMQATAARLPDATTWREVLAAEAAANDASGVRRIKIRDWHFIQNDSFELGDYALGPTANEVFCASLASCLTHIVLILAATRDLALESVQTLAEADISEAGLFGVSTNNPGGLFNIQLTVALDAPTMTTQAKHALIEDAEAQCGIVMALRMSNNISLAITE